MTPIQVHNRLQSLSAVGWISAYREELRFVCPGFLAAAKQFDAGADAALFLLPEFHPTTDKLSILRRFSSAALLLAPSWEGLTGPPNAGAAGS